MMRGEASRLGRQLARAGAVAAAGALAWAAPAAAHAGAPLAPHDLAQGWTFDPWLLAGLLALAGVYGRGIIRLWRAAGVGHGVARRQVVLFGLGLAVLAGALMSPVHALGEVLFAAHMAQHLLLMVVAAPLLAWGASPAVWWWAMPSAWRRPLAHAWRRQAWVHRAGGWLLQPWAVLALSTVALWAWHLPQWYGAALADDRLHALEHLSLLGSALLFWWVMSPQAGRQRVAAGIEPLLLFAAAVQSAVLGALITFAPAPWIATYRLTAPLWGLSALADQQAAGALMWGPMGLVYIVAALGLLAQRLLRSEEAGRQL